MSDSQRFVADLLTSRRATVHRNEPTRGTDHFGEARYRETATGAPARVAVCS